MKITEARLRTIIREQLVQLANLAETDTVSDIRYSNKQQLYDTLRPLVNQAWEETRARAIEKFPSHALVLRRTRFIPLFTAQDSRPTSLNMNAYGGLQSAAFLSKCDDLFATSRAGTKCRAEGNLANPPTHNAIYLDVPMALGLDTLPAAGAFTWREKDITDTLMHEIAHAVDRLSSVTHGEQINSAQDIPVGDIFDLEALNDKRYFLDQVEDRLIRAGTTDDAIDRMLTGAAGGWDHLVGSGWLKKRPEQVALLIQLVTFLDHVGIPASDFLTLDFEDGRNSAAAAGLIDWTAVQVLYGLIDEEGVIGLEGIKGATR